ncbi:hypothetical protein BG004_006801 [Podila humilis]|nr:hypothetical protein BG004_006801 [Podila humilis]
MLLVGTNNGPNGPASGGNANEGDNEPLDEDPKPTEIVITSKTKTIVIGVGCAVGALVLAGFIGFYFIRYSNRRAEKEHSARKLREPIQTGPLFSPMSRPNGSNGGSGGNGTGGNSRYNELSSVTTDSLGTGSPTTTAKTEMVDMGGYNSAKMTPISAAHGLPASRVASPSLISRSTTPTPVAAPHAPPSRAASPVPGSPTPIAAMHAKMASPALASASWAVNGSTGHGEPRPSSLLTSPFIPAEDTSTNGQNPFEQRQYGH